MKLDFPTIQFYQRLSTNLYIIYAYVNKEVKCSNKICEFCKKKHIFHPKCGLRIYSSWARFGRYKRERHSKLVN